LLIKLIYLLLMYLLIPTGLTSTYFFHSDYGDDEVSTLAAHFTTSLTTAGVQLEEIDTEWALLKKNIHDRYASYFTPNKLIESQNEIVD
jgi:hypothetical protein